MLPSSPQTSYLTADEYLRPISAQSGSSGPGKSCPLGSWLDQLAALCWVALSCLVFSNYLDYYDELQHQSYMHLVPIDVFPRVMPVVVVFIICALFALGLEVLT